MWNKLIILCYITSQFATINCLFARDLTQNVAIDLSSYDKENKSTHVFMRYINLAEGNVIVNIVNSPDNQGFFVIQAHSLSTNISLSKTKSFSPHSFVTGTNVGLVEQGLSSNTLYHYFIDYVEKSSLKILLAIVVYEKTDPVPGGCNLVFNTEIAPYQLVTYNEHIIKVDAQPPSVYKRICESNGAMMEMYHMFLYERNMDEDVYFQAIRQMLTVEGIEKMATRVREGGRSTARRYYSAYPGTGSIYAIIARHRNVSSAYVPAVTYACDINNWDESCNGPVTIPWKIICAIILFLGFFTCYFGHRFFKTQMFIFGFVFGGFISYVATSLSNALSVGETLGISIMFGCLYGATWIVLWWRFGSPIVSVFLPVAFIGYITSCAVFYTGFGDFQIFQNDLNYWGTFLSILIPITALLLVVTMFANILACSVLGASSIAVAIDHYMGGNIHYIILNNIRRATITNFNVALINPPFQYRDAILVSIWVVLVLTGVYAQLRQQRGKPPFPPPSLMPRRNSERTPLLSASNSLIYT